MKFNDLNKSKTQVLLECISGSRAYGLETSASDTDIKGVFYMPKDQFYGLSQVEQLNNASNDEVYYEVKRFVELLKVNNPNILELLASPSNCILHRHPIMDMIKPEMFISKLCKNTFGRYAISQIKKAKGLKKKIQNPFSKKKKSVLDFCHVNYKSGSKPVLSFLDEMKWNQSNCGLTNIPNMKGMYGLYYSSENDYKGIAQKENAT